MDTKVTVKWIVSDAQGREKRCSEKEMKLVELLNMMQRRICRLEKIAANRETKHTDVNLFRTFPADEKDT